MNRLGQRRRTSASVAAYIALAPADRRLLVRAFVSLAVIHLALRFSGFERLAGPSWGKRGHGISPEELLRARRYAYWIDVASRHHPVKARCLHRSLVLLGWLRREGLSGELRIGVRKEDRALKAHAWVELDGLVVNDHPSSIAAFTPLGGRQGEHPADAVSGLTPARLVSASLGGQGWE